MFEHITALFQKAPAPTPPTVTRPALPLNGLLSPGVAAVKPVPPIVEEVREFPLHPRSRGLNVPPADPAPEIVLPAANAVQEEPLDFAYDDWNKSPRSPQMIARLLQVETSDQTARRIASDCSRMRRQRGLI